MLLDFLVCSEIELIYHLILRAKFISILLKKSYAREDASTFKLLPKDNSIFFSSRGSQLRARNIPLSSSVLQRSPDAVNVQTHGLGTPL